MVDARNRARLEIARRATNALRHQDFRSSLATCVDGVSRPVIAALDDDRMSDVFAQLKRYECSATLVTAVDDGGIAIVAVYPATADDAAGDRSVEDDCPIHCDTEIGMLLLYLRSHPVLRCRLVTPGCEMELVDDGGAVTVPG